MPTQLCWWVSFDKDRLNDIKFIQQQAAELNAHDYPPVNDMRRLINILKEWISYVERDAEGPNYVEDIQGNSFDILGKFCIYNFLYLFILP